MSDDRTLDLENELLRHGDLVRSVARRLVDPSAVDDVVQEAWLRALEKRPTVGGGLRGWLARVTGRVALKLHRDDRRRHRRESVAAKIDIAESVPTEREEIVRDLIDAVLDLDDRHRAVVLMRYYDGATPAEIADRLGLPAVTVRTRLHRAMSRLRERLDTDAGGRERWTSLLVPFLFDPATLTSWGLGAVSSATASSATPTIAAGAATTGGLFVTKKLAVVAAIAVLGCLSWFVWDVYRSDADEGLESIVPTDVTTSVNEDPRRAATSEDVALLPNDALSKPDADQSDSAESKVDTAAVDVPRASIAGRVLDASSAPIDAASIFVRIRGHAGASQLTNRTTTRRTTTDRDGRFVVEALPVGDEVSLRVRTDEHCDVHHHIALDEPGRHEIDDVVLRRGTAVTGRVVAAERIARGATDSEPMSADDDDLDVRPVVGASVRIWQRAARAGAATSFMFGGSSVDAREVMTDATGRFRLDGLADGEWILEARHAAWKPGRRHAVHIRDAKGIDGLTVRLLQGLEIIGVVRDDAGPLAGVSVASERIAMHLTDSLDTRLDHRRTTTDENGRFTLRGLDDVEYELSVRRRGYVDTWRRAVPSVKPLDISVARSGRVELLVVERESGRPIPSASARVLRSPRGGFGATVEESSGVVLRGEEARRFLGRDAPGTLVATDLATEVVSLEVSAPGYAVHRLRDVAVASGETVEMRAELDPEIGLAGVVFDPSGRPRAGALVVVGPTDNPESRRVDDGAGSRRVIRSVRDDSDRRRRVMCDDDGRFVVRGLRRGAYRLFARDRAFAASEPIVVDESGARDRDTSIELRLRNGGGFVGRAFERPGVPWPGARVRLTPRRSATDGSADGNSALVGGRRAETSVVADAGGRFRFDGVVPGTYGAKIAEPEVAGGTRFAIEMPGVKKKEEPAIPVDIAAGEITTVDLVAPPRATLTGRVTEAGEARPGVRVSASLASASLPFGGTSATTDDWGEFVLPRLAPGRYELRVMAPGAGEPVKRIVELEAHGDEHVDVELPTGVIAGRLVDAAGRGLAGIVVGADAQREGEIRRTTAIAVTLSSAGRPGMRSLSVGGTEIRTDPLGRFELRNLADGMYRVRAGSGAWIPQERRDVEVTEGRKTRGVDFEMKAGAKVRVELRGATSGAAWLVQCRSDDHRGPPPYKATQGEPVEFEGLGPGRYTVTLRPIGPDADGASDVEKTVTVREGEDQVVTVDV